MNDTIQHTFAPGTVVWVGEPGDPTRKSTWQVQASYFDVDHVEQVVLFSGRTGRHATYPASRLTRFRLVEVS